MLPVIKHVFNQQLTIYLKYYLYPDIPWVDLQPPRDDTHELTVTVAVIARRITNSVLFIFVVFRVELSHAKQGLNDHRVIQRKRTGKQNVSSAKRKSFEKGSS